MTKSRIALVAAFSLAVSVDATADNWLLISPKMHVFPHGGMAIGLNVPISKWEILGVFGTANECKVVHQGLLDKVCDSKDGLYECTKMLSSECIAESDPRFEE